MTRKYSLLSMSNAGMKSKGVLESEIIGTMHEHIWNQESKIEF